MHHNRLMDITGLDINNQIYSTEYNGNEISAQFFQAVR